MKTRPDPATATATDLESPIAVALRGARENLGPGLVLQAFALALVVSYYNIPAVTEFLNRFEGLREQWGVLLPMVTTAFCGAVFPFIYLRLLGGAARRQSWKQGLALLAFWIYKGFEIDLLYRVMAALYGEGVEVGRILLKLVTDQFFYTPLWAALTSWAVYAIVAVNFDFAAFRRELATPGWYRRHVFPLVVSTWGVWIPAVAVIYALPTPLQLPVQNLVLVFFTLIIQTLSLRKQQSGEKPEVPVLPGPIPGEVLEHVGDSVPADKAP